MRKLLFVMSFLGITLLFISCGSNHTGNDNTPKKEQEAFVPVDKPKPIEPITITPTEFGLTELSVEKREEGECGAKGNISAQFQISFIDSISSSPYHYNVYGYDCGDGKEDQSMAVGKRVKGVYDMLKGANVNDLAVTYIYIDGLWKIKKAVIKEKRTPGKKGSPSEVEPEVLITF